MSTLTISPGQPETASKQTVVSSGSVGSTVHLGASASPGVQVHPGAPQSVTRSRTPPQPSSIVPQSGAPLLFAWRICASKSSHVSRGATQLGSLHRFGPARAAAADVAAGASRRRAVVFLRQSPRHIRPPRTHTPNRRHPRS